MVPDDVLFESGAGKMVRRTPLGNCEVQTLLRLPTGGILRPRGQGKRAVLPAWGRGDAAATREQWIYDLRTNQHFTLKANPLQRHHTILNSIVRNRVYRNPTSSSPVVFKTIAFSASSTASNRRTSRQRGQLCHRRLRVCRSVEHAADGAIFHFVVGHA